MTYTIAILDRHFNPEISYGIPLFAVRVVSHMVTVMIIGILFEFHPVS